MKKFPNLDLKLWRDSQPDEVPPSVESLLEALTPGDYSYLEDAGLRLLGRSSDDNPINDTYFLTFTLPGDAKYGIVYLTSYTEEGLSEEIEPEDMPGMLADIESGEGEPPVTWVLVKRMENKVILLGVYGDGLGVAGILGALLRHQIATHMKKPWGADKDGMDYPEIPYPAGMALDEL